MNETKNIEYDLWGTKNGKEDIIRVNGSEVQTNKEEALKIKSLLIKRGDFQKIRIQTIDLKNYNLKSEFERGLN